MIIILWLNEHRLLVVFTVAAILWIGAYGMYFRLIIQNWFYRRRPHSWSVDMVNKKAIARGQEQV